MDRTEALTNLRQEFAARLQAEASTGAIDLKMLCDTGRDTSSHLLAWTLNNALKQVQEGKVRYVKVSDVNKLVIGR